MHIATYVIILCFMTPSLKAFENKTLTPYVQISCCAMLSTLTEYTVDSTGDRVHESNCKNHECFKLQIVDLFVNHTRVMLGDFVSTDDNYIKIENTSLLENSKTTLVLALLGRASLPEKKIKQAHVSLEYNTALDTLSVKDSTCATDKTIYSTIIIASIALLLFFIATNIVNSQHENHAANVIVDATTLKTIKPTNMQFLRMRL